MIQYDRIMQENEKKQGYTVVEQGNKNKDQNDGESDSESESDIM